MIWTQIGGDGVRSSWTGHSRVNALWAFNNKLYAGLGTGANDAEVWEYNGNYWVKIGGDGVRSSWTSINYTNVLSLQDFDNKLYAGLGGIDTWARVWEYNTSTETWTEIGGNGLNNSWNGNEQSVDSLGVYGGELYAGVGHDTTATGGQLWKYNGTTWTQVDDLTAQYIFSMLVGRIN